MFVPDTQIVALALALCSMVCWGSWSNFLILTEGRMEFELFYLDFSVGCLLISIIFGATLGSMTNDSLPFGPKTFMDDFGVDLKHVAEAMCGGLLFNIAGICLCKGISMLGLALAFPLCVGTSMVLGTLLTYALDPSETKDPVLLFVGLSIAFLAVVVAAVMHSIKDKEKAANEPLTADVEGRDISNPEPSMLRKLVICIIGGIVMGCWNPMVALSEKDGLSPYGEFFFFSLAILLSSLVLMPLIIAYPLEGHGGKPVFSVLAQCTKTPTICHLYGLLGGLVWSVGTLTNGMAGAATASDGTPVMTSATSYAIGQCANVAAIFWGLCVWREFNGTSSKVKMLVALVVALYITAIAFCTLSN